MEIDLTKKDNSCVGHPIVRLNRMLRNLQSKVVRVIFDPNVVPKDVVVLLLERRGFRLVEEGFLGSHVVLLFELEGV